MHVRQVGRAMCGAVPATYNHHGRVTMFQVQRMYVKGFWGTHEVGVDLDPEVNFFIGPNGSGKTTLINLLAAVLTGNFPTLDRIPFDEILVDLLLVPDVTASEAKNKKAHIAVTKRTRGHNPIEYIEYKISRGDSGNDLLFSLDEYEERLLIRTGSRYVVDAYSKHQFDVRSALSSIVNVTWLSVYRTQLEERSRDGRTFESVIDKRLEELGNALVRYLSELNSQKDSHLRSFQEYIFLSLLETPGGSDKPSSESDLTVDREIMIDVFRDINLTGPTVEKKIDQFFKNLSRSLAISPEGATAEDIAVLFNMDRIEKIINEWLALQEKLKIVFAPKQLYTQIINNLLRKKRIAINEKNEFYFESESGKTLTFSMLSSGEKLLLILLTEALLQKGRASVFIADEPELSLHVSWQEKLVPSLRQLNRSSQIIAATHSPDIVGRLTSRIIDMEAIIK
jgi:predicted ATP-dependent endonuclease of OLD family